MQTLQQRLQANVALQILARQIEITRMLALHNNKSYKLCASKDGKSCSEFWGNGLLLQDLDGANKIYTPNWQPPCKLYFKGRLLENAIVFAASGYTAGIQGRFYCEMPRYAKVYSLLLRVNGSVGYNI